MTIRLHRGDLPDLSRYTDSVAIDTETMGCIRIATGSACGADVERRAAPTCADPQGSWQDPADAPTLKRC